jgi:hypothetical protein
MRAKSTTARREFHDLPKYCTDTLALSRHEPSWSGFSYMPEHITDWSAQSQHVADHWLTMPGPWCIEGVATARALRKWADSHEYHEMPCDRIVVFRHPHPEADVTAAQERMAKGVWTVWQEIADRFAGLVEYR